MFARLFRPLRVLQAALHRLIGRASYQFGARDRARRHFERVLELRGDDFTAYVFLGRIAYDNGDILGWRRECLHARRMAPERYARLRDRFELRSRFELYEPADATPQVGTLGGASERATWRSAVEPSVFGLLPPLTATASLVGWGDDFSSESERALFCSLPPITADELAEVDLDELARLLTATGASDGEIDPADDTD